MLDFASSKDLFVKEDIGNIIHVFFDNFINLSKKSFYAFFDRGHDFLLASIIHILLEKNSDIEDNFELLKQSIAKVFFAYPRR